MAQRYNLLFGGPAGSGPNIVTHIVGEALVKLGYYVFYSRDYQSLIRGGHNFNVLTFSEEPVYSNDSEIDLLVAFDDLTETLHKKELKKNGVILKGNHENMYFAGRIFKLMCIEFKVLDDKLKELGKKYDENIKEAKQGYEEEKKNICRILPKKESLYFMDGNDGIAEGAILSGLDVYMAYPMTPSTSVLNKLAEKQAKPENKFVVLELENELAIANAGVGSAATGAKTMVGSSGGGMDLMTEAMSMTGMAEVPLVFFLAQRPGPGTGVPTYSSQGDLNMARHAGHGEFQRIVVAPGDPKDALELTNQAFYFSQKFKIPTMIVSDKHLGESFYTLTDKGKTVSVPKAEGLGRVNSYERENSNFCATEDAATIKANFERRLKKAALIEKESRTFSRYEVYDNKGKNKTSKCVVLSWGSTKGGILDAIKDLKCKFIQVKYIEPFPKDIEKELKGKKIILVENTSTGILADILRENTGIFIDDKNKILRYDGRPFLADELNKEIKKRLGK